ncbi:hypothetical protein ACOHO0_003903, partial [Cronobacter sakazakii]
FRHSRAKAALFNFSCYCDMEEITYFQVAEKALMKCGCDIIKMIAVIFQGGTDVCKSYDIHIYP